MTINKLHKELEKLIENGYGRKKVMINKDTFNHVLEGDGCVILPVKNLSVGIYHIINDDGGITHGDDGHEKFETSLVLTGDKTPARFR